MIVTELDSAKRAFEAGHYEAVTLKIEKILHHSLPFASVAVLRANLFIADVLHSHASLDESKANDALALLSGISPMSARANAIASFVQNLVLYQISRKEFDSALRLCANLQPGPKTDDLVASIFISRRRFEGCHPSSFFRIWKSHFFHDHDSVLQISGELLGAPCVDFLCGIAHLQSRKWREAFDFFNRSISHKFRLADSQSCAGICSFYLNMTKQAIDFFEQSVRSTAHSPISLLNLAEMCGFLGRSYEQQLLLEFHARTERVLDRGSLSTLYRLAVISLKDGDYETAAERYEAIRSEAIASGCELPSPTFCTEHAHALNHLREFEDAQAVLLVDAQSRDEAARLVSGHSLWLARKFAACRQMLDGLRAAEAVANRGLLAFVAGNHDDAVRQLSAARKCAPQNMAITRAAALVLFAKRQTVNDGCVTWLTAMNFQIDNDAQFDDAVLEKIRYGSKKDQLTIAALTAWRGRARDL
jgi:tetratricopeptide (TPR) repeat protein